MAMYALKDTTLTALGDAVRSKAHDIPEIPYIKAEGIIIEDDRIHSIVFPEGVKKITVNVLIHSQVSDNGYFNLSYAPGIFKNNSTGCNNLRNTVGGATFTDFHGEEHSHTFTVNGNSVSMTTNEFKLYREHLKIDYEAIGLDENGNEYKYTPLEMVDVINGLYVPKAEPIVLTDNQEYGCAGLLSSYYIKMFGNTISTDSITTATSMFYRYGGEYIPFEINLKKGTYVSLKELFSLSKLTTLPKINNAYPNEMNYMFYGCDCLRNIPDDYFDNFDFSKIHTYSSAGLNYMFTYCHALRKIPEKLLSELWGIGNLANHVPYNYFIPDCLVLDEVRGMAVHQGSLNSNRCAYMVNGCHRLKDFTFATNEDGTAKTAKWKSQTLDFSSYVGYVESPITISSITNKYTGITPDKEVTDDATYQDLKNDPDWFTIDVNYSRYNHDSAVNTINSLPDCSATGTNTIKFKGASGALTDGGAINTLTEEEIAVATAKGWTVSLV